PLSYSASHLPPGLSIDSGTGEITGTLSSAGTFHPTVTVTDGISHASTTFEWDVCGCGCSGGGSVTINGSARQGSAGQGPGDQFDNAGDTVSLQIDASKTGTGTLSYSASGLPTGLSINSSTGLISGTISSSLSPDIYPVTLVVTDGDDTLTVFFDWTV